MHFSLCSDYIQGQIDFPSYFSKLRHFVLPQENSAFLMKASLPISTFSTEQVLLAMS